MKFVALLRGINVSGQKLIKMADLKMCFEQAGFQQVQTYIQSGNIIFLHPDSHQSELEIQIESLLFKSYGFKITTIVKQLHDLEKAIDENPFLKDVSKDQTCIYFAFFKGILEVENIIKLQQKLLLPEEYVITKNTIHFYVPKGYGKSKMNNNYFESVLKTKSTSRNLKTVMRLIDLLKD